jgi:hypothetical protein
LKASASKKLQEELGIFILTYNLIYLDGLDSEEIELNLKGGSDHDILPPQEFQVIEEYVSGEEDGENHL